MSTFNPLYQSGLIEHLGIEFTHVTSEHVEAILPVDERTCQPFGYLHGGATIALAESIAGLGSSQRCTQKQYAVGIQVSANHFIAVKKGDVVVGKGILIHQSNALHTWNVDIFNSEEQLIASIRITNRIVTPSLQSNLNHA